LHCGHNTHVSLMKKHLVFGKIDIANEIKIRHFIIFNIKKNCLYVDFKCFYIYVEIMIL